jgi:hypothetical protein
MLCQVHGHPQLRLPQTQDTWTRRGHQYGGQDVAGAGLRAGQHQAGCHSNHGGRTGGAQPLDTYSTTKPGHARGVQHFQDEQGRRGHTNRCRGPCQNHADWGQFGAQIGKCAHQFPPMQQGHVSVDHPISCRCKKY